MANSPSTIHYTPGTQQKVSTKTALIIIASGAILFTVAILSVAHAH
jgi:hypothetical protein